jgi:sugar phosphate isomerase/epimerase
VSRLSFTTLGCPNWDLATICRRGREYGFSGVDFRGYLESVDITTRPEFTSAVADTRRRLDEAGLEVSAISSSLQVCEPGRQPANLEEARRTIAVAHDLACGNVRVFGGGDLRVYSRQTLAEFGRESIEQVLALDGAQDLHWLFETHDLWVRAADCRLFLDSIPNAAFGALWDMGHTYRVGAEQPTATLQALQGRVGYVHLKDAVHEPGHPRAMEDGWRYVLPGTGQLPLAESIRMLYRQGYAGWWMFEHEKRWHPDLPEPEIALPAFTRWFGTLAL